MKNTATRGFTLIELILVVALIGLFSIPLIFGIRKTGQTQNIRTSVSVLSDDLQIVKVSAREARDKASWGIVTISPDTYQIMKSVQNVKTPITNRTLENGVTFVKQFSLWFEIGTGNVSPAQTIEITNLVGQTYEITVNELGTISVTTS